MWSPVHATGTPPVGRAHASAAYFREQIFVFGGCNGTVASNYRRDLVVLNLRTLNWTEVLPASPAPMGRSHAAMCCYNGQLYLFGGHNLQGGRRRPLGDLQVFDILKDRTWTLLTDSDVGLGPSPRSWHSMLACNHGIFLFGGAAEASSPAPFFDTLWVFNPVSLAWHNLSRRPGARGDSTSLLPSSPNARAAVAMATTACSASPYLLYVIGGISSSAPTRPGSGATHKSKSQSVTSEGAGHGTGPSVIMGDVFKVDLRDWHNNLPASEIEAEFNQADFTGRALASMPRAGGQTLRAEMSEVPRLAATTGRRSTSSMSSSTASSSTASGALSPVVKRAVGLKGFASNDVQFSRRQRAAPANADSSCMVWDLHQPRGEGMEGEAPTPRSGHAAVTIGRRMYVCGGLAEEAGHRDYLMDLFQLDLHTMLWSRVEVADGDNGEDGYMPEGRAGHNMVAVERGHALVWLLCGWCVHDGKSFFFNDVHTFDPLKREWGVVKTVGEAPAARAYASAAVYKTKIILFGGCNGTLAAHFRNDLWTLDVQHHTWARIKIMADQVQPSGRAQHAMVHYGGHLYVFGGNNKRGGKRHLLADMYLFDVAQSRWVLLNDGHGGGEAGAQGEAPSKRSGHAMVIQNGGLFVFGGGGEEEGADGFYDSLWVFDTAARRWSLLTQEDEQGLVGSKRPCARAGHSMVAVGDQVIVFGGLCPSGGGQGAGVRALGDLASFVSTGWRHAMPKFVSERQREAATRLLAKLQGLDDHASSRLLDSVHAFRGAAREAYNKALEKPYADSDDDDVEIVDPDVIPLSHSVSAQLSVLNQRIDSIVGRLAPQRRDLLQMQRQAQLGPIMAQGGLLEVGVLSGRDLPKMDRFGKSDPYCVVEVEGHKHKTKILKKTLNPVWKETFKFKVKDTGSRVVVTCFDWDFADEHDFMGQIVVKLDDLLDGPVDQFYTLRDADGQTLQGSLRLQLAYKPADTGINDAKHAIVAALQTLPPDQQEDILGVSLDWQGADAAAASDVIRQGAVLGVHAKALSQEQDPAEALAQMPPVHALALQEEAAQRAQRERRRVERQRQDNLAEIERLRSEQLRDEALERKIRQLSTLEQQEKELRARRQVEEEEQAVDKALVDKLGNIAKLADPKPIDPAIDWSGNPAHELQASLDDEYAAMKKASSPETRRRPALAQPLKPHPPAAGERVDAGASGSRPRPPSSRGDDAFDSRGGAGAGKGQGGGHSRRSVLTTMFGKGVSVEAKRRMMQELRAKKKGEEEGVTGFQEELRVMQERMKEEAEREERERVRLEKLDAAEEERKRIAMQIRQEQRTKAQIAEKRERIIQELEEAEATAAQRKREEFERLEAKRRESVAAEEERRRKDPALVARSKRLTEYVPGCSGAACMRVHARACACWCAALARGARLSAPRLTCPCRLLPHMMVSRHSLDGLTPRWRGHDTDTGFVFGSGDDERPEWLSAGTGTQGRLVASADAQHRARQRTSTHTVSSDGCDRSGSLCSGGPRSVACLCVSLASGPEFLISAPGPPAPGVLAAL